MKVAKPQAWLAEPRCMSVTIKHLRPTSVNQSNTKTQLPQHKLPLTAPAEVDEHGNPFEVWVVQRSFALLAPVCRLGLVAALLFLCVADPAYHLLGLWSPAVPLRYLVAWHAAIALLFIACLLAGQRVQTHTARLRTLEVFSFTAALLFVWFGVISWLATGDLSIVAIAQLLLAAVFTLPGNFRRWIYGVQVLTMGLLLAWLDSSGKFLGQMHFANLLVIAGVAYAIDGYMLKNALTLFSQQCQVARERLRADSVLYNALPLDIAEELKTHHRVKAQSYPAMSILFADIVGFTQFAATRSPDEVLSILNELFSRMDALIDTDRVEKIKTIGDAYMAVSKEDPAALARLALSMQEVVVQYNLERAYQFSLRIGMHCGPTIAGVIGQKRFLYDVWSDAVNLASRMESTGVPDRIQTSEAMFQQLRTRFEFEERGLVDIKGKGPLRTYYLQGQQEAQPA
jgi:class 3 adenylate cyclase